MPLANMLPEVAYIKFGWALGLHPEDLARVKELMTTTIAGEMTKGEPFDRSLMLQGGIPEARDLIGKIWW